MTEMNALLLRQDGFAETAQAIGNRLEAPQEYLRYGPVPRPTPGKGQILIQVRRAVVNPSDRKLPTKTPPVIDPMPRPTMGGDRWNTSAATSGVDDTNR